MRKIINNNQFSNFIKQNNTFLQLIYIHTLTDFTQMYIFTSFFMLHNIFFNDVNLSYFYNLYVVVFSH